MREWDWDIIVPVGFILFLIIASILAFRYSYDTAQVASPQGTNQGYMIRCGPAGTSDIKVTTIDNKSIYVSC